MSNVEIMPKFTGSKQNANKLLEDIRLLTGLSQEEMAEAFLLLDKADMGSLHFDRGNTDIRFESMRVDRLNRNDICVKLEVREDGFTRSVEYNIPSAYIRLLKRKMRDKLAHDVEVNE